MGLPFTLLGSPVGGLLTNLLGGFLNNRDWQNFIQHTEGTYNAPLREEARNLGFGSKYNPVEAAQDLSRTGQRYTEQQLSGVVPAYQKLFTQAQQLQGQTSDQALADVNRRYDLLGEGDQAALRANGLGGSTIGINAQYGNEANRISDLNRTRDQLLQQQLGVLGSFGAAVPQAQQNVGQYLSDSNYRYGTLPIDTRLASGNAALNAYTSQYLFPPPGFNPITIQPR